jgi:hypothetical protein
MERPFTAGNVLLLISTVCSLQCVNLLAQPVDALYRDRLETRSTHTVFRGAGNPYGTASSINSDVTRSLLDWGQSREGAPLPWRYNIIATVFWVGELASELNPISNVESAWDADWVMHYGGEDDPLVRLNFMPLSFVPKLNPFYVALPYNDVQEHHTKPDAAKTIPWFNVAFVRDGESVCKGRWVAIRHGKRVCYAQWEDVGPYESDHWQYVFGNERPHPNANHDAGIDVSPAVRDYLGFTGMDVCDWRFVNVWEIPNGPWALYGNGNTAAHLRGQLRIPKLKRPGVAPGLEAARAN